MNVGPRNSGRLQFNGWRIVCGVMIAAGVVGPRAAVAEVKVNPLFAHHAVLQREMEVPVWGTARDGEQVTVEIQGQKVTTTAVAGRWLVRLKALQVGGPFTMTVRGDNHIALTNILVGEVWLCSGQSNMEWALARSDGGTNAIATASNPLLRMCRVPHNVQFTPQTEVRAKWELCSPATATNFSAIPYWFGDKLQKELDVPVGIINSAFGGTPIQAWMPPETLKAGPWPQDKWNDPVQAKADYDQKVEATRVLKEKYEAEKAEAIAKHLPVPLQPAGIPSEFKGATTLWNGEVAPLLPYRIRGVAWYQGENNAYIQVAHDYKNLLPAMIRDWRQGFEQPDLPFLIFQIARNRRWQTDANEASGIAEVQEAQAKVAQTTPHTALVVTTDMGGPDVHYTGKEPVAERGVKAALVVAYGHRLRFSGPVFQSAQFENGKAILRFSETSGGLKTDDGALSGFVIAGADKTFCFADAKIDGDAVIVSCPQVPDPVAVRYGWADLPKVNLFNRAGLPASTFRTDNWPLTNMMTQSSSLRGGESPQPRELRTRFLPDQPWPDDHGIHINAHGGGVMFFEGVYYWFGEHKIAGDTAESGVHCYSSTDLYNWKDRGIALAMSDDPQSDITKGCILERPKVVFNARTKKFVMWFHLELKGQARRAARSGVAISDSPTGPYRFLRSVRPDAGTWPINVTEAQKAGFEEAQKLLGTAFLGGPNPEVPRHNLLARDFTTGQMAKDMTLFVDDDGTAYHVFASEENSTLHISQLTDDYLAHAGKWARLFEHRWNEAPALFKFKGRYWLLSSGCTGWDPNTARLAVADSIWGPWQELGNPLFEASPVGEVVKLTLPQWKEVGYPSVGGNPRKYTLGPETTFGGQSTCVLPVNGRPGAFIAMFDVWRPQEHIKGGYLWLPMKFENDRFSISWRDAWDLSVFDD